MSAQTSGGTDRDQLPDLLLDSEDIAGFLSDFTATLTRRLAPDGTGTWCAVTLLRRHKATTVASSSPQAEALDETQTRFRDGPCLTAIREHTVVRVGDVATDTRWPGYCTTAAGQGVVSIIGVPFELGEEAQAGLNVYSARAHDFDPAAVAALRHEVAVASGALRLAVRLARHRETESDLAAAMASRTTIDLAVGIIMGQNRCSQERAFEILRAASSHRNRKLRDVAADLVTTVGAGPAITHFDA
ncbi:GAF and ANTAR domain-containing protein [Kocuria aegyptia]|uniref:GAF and ANTAR domain-containing protein n=1 Tax=Kocuria aegyptia TaxID=330943 RepID=A0ABN2KN54_9MICC